MNKIVCKIDPGLGRQHIMFFKNDILETQESVALTDLVNFLLKTCYTENCYNLHFIGNQQFLEGIVEQISTEEATKYNTNKILIEVN